MFSYCRITNYLAARRRFKNKLPAKLLYDNLSDCFANILYCQSPESLSGPKSVWLKRNAAGFKRPREVNDLDAGYVLDVPEVPKRADNV